MHELYLCSPIFLTIHAARTCALNFLVIIVTGPGRCFTIGKETKETEQEQQQTTEDGNNNSLPR